MPEESKFAGTLKRLRRPPETPEAPPAAREPDRAPTPAPGVHRGKRSDPEWANVTLLMRRSVKRDARRRLEDEGEGVDLSELIDRLLTEWLGKSNG